MAKATNDKLLQRMTSPIVLPTIRQASGNIAMDGGDGDGDGGKAPIACRLQLEAADGRIILAPITAEAVKQLMISLAAILAFAEQHQEDALRPDKLH